MAFWAFISFHFGLLGLHFLSFWLFAPSKKAICQDLAQNCHFPFKFCNFSFSKICLLGFISFRFLSFWPFGPSFPFILAFSGLFPFILAFWAFISFHFGLLGFHVLSFWPFGPSFPFIFGLSGLPRGARPQVAKNGRFLMKFKQILSAPTPAAFCNFRPSSFHFAFWAFISFHFELLGFYFFSFWPFGPSFPFILAFWAFIPFILAFWGFISFHFGLSFPFILAFWGLHVLSFWPFGLSFPFIFGLCGLPRGVPPQVAKTARFLMKFIQILPASRPAAFCNFWPFKPFPFIFAFWAFISFHFRLLGFHFRSFWPFGLLFPFILAFWAFISIHFGLLGFMSFHFGLLGLHFLSSLVCLGCHVGSPPQVAKNGPFPNEI